MQYIEEEGYTRVTPETDIDKEVLNMLLPEMMPAETLKIEDPAHLWKAVIEDAVIKRCKGE